MDKRIPEYTIITRNKVLENNIEDVLKEQNEKMEILGLNEDGYICHFFNAGPEYKIVSSIDEAIEYLNMKEGADLVQFCNGNYGYVAYCNGKEDAFEIRNYNDCADHPEKWEDMGIQKRSWWYTEPTHAKCSCGYEVILQGDTYCDGCGQLYNQFGQALKDPSEWEENDYDDEW